MQKFLAEKGRINMRQSFKFAATLIAVFCLTTHVRADDGAAITNYINGLHPTGDLVATFNPGYSTVTVTGKLGATPSNADYLTLNIDYGVTVVWEAELAGNPSDNYSLINISGGSGTFELRSGGSIENTGAGRAMTNNSACTVNITGGTVTKNSSGYTIHNGSSGTINVSDGTVLNQANSAYAIYNASTGAVNVTGGTVRAAYAIYNYNSTYNSSTGDVKVSGGLVTTGTGRAIYNSGGTVEVSGGTVSATGGEAIYNYSGTTEVSNGIVSATTGNAILISGGTVNISGSALITSESTSSYGGTIYFSGGILNINGGTVENTATTHNKTIYNYFNSGTLNVMGGTVKSENGDAIYTYYNGKVNISGGTVSTNGSGTSAIYSSNNSSITVTITGGTVEATQNNAYAVSHESSPKLILGGNPAITGRIFTFPERLETITDGDDIFTPSQIYILDFPTAQYAVSKIAVTNGWSYLDNFVLYNPDFALMTSSVHLAIAAAYKVTYFLDGGEGVPPVNISIPQQGYIKVKPPTDSYSKAGYIHDGNWWYGSSSGPAIFVFGNGGTQVMQNMLLYLVWTPVTYSITYNLDGGTNHPSNPATYTVDSENITLQPPAKEGLAFNGWWDSSTDGTRVTSIASGSEGNITLWARWLPVHIIAFNANGGAVNPASGTTGDFGRLTSLPVPTRDGFVFEGWFTALTGGNEVTINTEFTANTTIYARWTPEYTITFDANGGTVTPASGTTGAGGKLATLPEPSRTGYWFMGWFNAVSGGDEVTEETVFNANTTIYAQWALLSYFVFFDATGGTIDPVFGVTDEGWKLAFLPVPTRTGGYAFDGWFTEPTGGDEVTENTVFSENITIYAHWSRIYIVTFNANGGTVSPTSATTGVGGTLSSLPNPTRTNFFFIGWFTSTTGGTEVTTDYVFTSNQTIYARWTALYTVTFNPNGGTVTPTTGTTGSDGRLASLPTPTRNGYTFNGWFTSAIGGTEITTGYVFTSNTTIYARWSQITSSPELETANPLRAWMNNGTLHVTGLTAGKTLSVYSLSGALIFRSVATSDAVEIPLQTQGVYIVQSENWTVRVVFN